MYTSLEGKILICREVDGVYWVEVILPSTQRMGVITNQKFIPGDTVEVQVNFEELVIRTIRYPGNEDEEPEEKPDECGGFDPDGLDAEDGALGRVC